MNPEHPFQQLQQAAELTAPEPRRGLAARLGCLAAAGVETVLASTIVGIESTPHTPSNYVYALVGAAVAGSAIVDAWRNVKATVTGRGTPSFKLGYQPSTAKTADAPATSNETK